MEKSYKIVSTIINYINGENINPDDREAYCVKCTNNLKEIFPEFRVVTIIRNAGENELKFMESTVEVGI